MKATGLMVGDWVNIKGKSVKVTLDDLRTMLILFEDVDFHIDPIPLTEEILVKNGFVKTWNGDWQLKEYATIIISKDYYVKIFERSIRIDYVHELQHMLHAACVDKELVID